MSHIDLDLDPWACLEATASQRKRLLQLGRSLSSDELETMSRCTEWTVADIYRHILDVDLFLISQLERALDPPPPSERRGNPLATFDPNETPKLLVDARRSQSPPQILEQLDTTTTQIDELLAAWPGKRLDEIVYCPAGPAESWKGCLHMLFDAWMHERDIAVPLGKEVPIVEDELRAVCAWQLVLAALVGGAAPVHAVVGFEGIGTLALSYEPVKVDVRSTDAPPDVQDDAVALVEAMAGRGSVTAAGDDELVARLHALARRFVPS